MRKHFREIDILKGIAIAMVLLGHSIIVYPININNIPWCGFLHSLVSTTHMPLFFMISGFCFGFSNWKDYLVKKFKRIFIPFVVFELLSAFVNHFFGSMINGARTFDKSIMVILRGQSNWFLYTIIIIFLVFPLIRKLFESKVAGIIAIIAFAVLYLTGIVPKAFNLSNVVQYLFYFSIGYYIKLRFREDNEFFKKLLKRLGTLPVWLISFAVWVGAYALLRSIEGVYTITRIPLAFLGILSVTAFVVLTRRFRFSNLFEEAGKYSLQLFLFNGYFLTLTRFLVVSKLHVTSPVVIIAANFTVMFFVSLLLIKFVVKPVKLFRTLTGLV